MWFERGMVSHQGLLCTKEHILWLWHCGMYWRQDNRYASVFCGTFRLMFSRHCLGNKICLTLHENIQHWASPVQTSFSCSFLYQMCQERVNSDSILFFFFKIWMWLNWAFPPFSFFFLLCHLNFVYAMIVRELKMIKKSTLNKISD